MNFEEHAAKLLLRNAGIRVPNGAVAASAESAKQIAAQLGPAVIKAQVPTGKRGKAGGIALVDNPDQALEQARRILSMHIGEHSVEKVLVEEQIPIAGELYMAIVNNAENRGPILLFSSEGGMDIEEIAANHPDKLVRYPLDIRRDMNVEQIAENLPIIDGVRSEQLAQFAEKLYQIYRTSDAELLEINPLALTPVQSGNDNPAIELVALDCKFILDDSAVKRQPELIKSGSPEKLTELEQRAAELNLKFIELEGTVGVLANGAGLTMTSMDAIRHYGGEPANFLEIGGESYRYGKEALELVLANPRVKSLLINFCGAFARTDVMAEGVIEAWQKLKPDIPVFFTIHGTGEDEAAEMVRNRLGLECFELMDDAVKAAVEAAK